MQGSIPKKQYVALNNNAGAFTVIRLTCMARYVEVIEDPSYNAGVAQGLQGNYLDPFLGQGGLTPAAPGGQIWPVPPVGTAAISLGDPRQTHGGLGMPLGNGGSGGNLDTPGGNVALGTPILQLRSNTATATGVIVSEWP